MTREKTLPFRSALSFRLGRPSWAIELMLGLYAIIFSVSVAIPDANGAIIAPFLGRAMAWLPNPEFWVYTLLFLGVIKLSLVHLWLIYAETPLGDKILKLRLKVTMGATFYWGMVITAIIGAEQPNLIVWRYGVALIGSMLAFLVLWEQTQREEEMYGHLETLCECCDNCGKPASKPKVIMPDSRAKPKERSMRKFHEVHEDIDREQSMFQQQQFRAFEDRQRMA